MLTNDELDTFNLEKQEELKATLNMISNWMVLPLYFLFWICDLLFYPQFKLEFLALRFLVVPSCLTVQFFSTRIKTFRQAELLALFFILMLASVINSMIFIIGDASTPYYAGLNLVAIGSLTFIPWSRKIYFCAILVIFGPYTYIALSNIHGGTIWAPILVHYFFIVGTIVITFVIRFFHERLRILEFKSRIKLNDEIGNRDQIIIEKTEEGLRLASLSSQFSPQVVKAIKDKKIDLNAKVHRSKICAIFIDIVNSTERVARVDKDKVHNSISMFMDDTIKILLKYDITIDKFLGDGILAFSNDPIIQSDFVERVLLASFEIRERIDQRLDYYEHNWLSPLQIKTGIAVGYANVGFYGNERYFKSYTAIGPVINLANRLCSVAEPNKIVVLSDVLEEVNSDNYICRPLGKLRLRGFESDVIKAFEVDSRDAILSSLSNDCDHCKQGIMQLSLSEKGIYQLICNHCGSVETNNIYLKIGKRTAS